MKLFEYVMTNLPDAFGYLTWQGSVPCWVFCSVLRLHTAVQLNLVGLIPQTAVDLVMPSPEIRRPNLHENMLS